MARLGIIGFFLVVVLALGLFLKRGDLHSTADAGAIDNDFGLVALPNGATMIAPKGTVGRRLVDWLDSDDTTPRWFDLGGQQFVGKDDQLAVWATSRVPRLIAMLKAYPHVALHVVGYTDSTGDPAANQRLSEQRAQGLVRLLRRDGIGSYRLSAEGRGSADSIGDNRTPEGRARNQRVVLVLSHK